MRFKEVIGFGWIFGEVEKFDFPTVSTWLGYDFPVIVDDCHASPTAENQRLFAWTDFFVHQLQKALPVLRLLHRGVRQPCNFGNGGKDIHSPCGKLRGAEFIYSLWPLDDGRHSDASLVQAPLKSLNPPVVVGLILGRPPLSLVNQTSVSFSTFIFLKPALRVPMLRSMALSSA